MKKAFVFILAFFYLAVASGVTVNLHYCMGELASVEYGHEAEGEGDCGKCRMPDNNNACCHTDSKLIKLQDDHQLSALAFKSKQPDVIHTFVPSYTPGIIRSGLEHQPGNIHSPPGKQFQHIYLNNCVFRI